ncbi:MAG: ABC transporter permease [Clostridia bacterium]|nr:ABC transporter permease [Clostridia bacterium]
MRILNFSKRNLKELIRDPISLIFEIVLPVFLLFIFKQFNIPAENYRLENFTPGIIVFGFSFITLFTATLIAKDRTSSFLIRLGTSPMKPADFILGYILSLIPIIFFQNVVFFAVAAALGLKLTVNALYTVIVSIAVSVLYISLGILIGSLVSEKGTGGLGSIVVQLVCFTSGMYFPKDQVGGVFAYICECLPFEGSLNIIRAVLNNDTALVSAKNIIVFAVYTVVVTAAAIIVFKKKMVSDNKG